MRKYIFIILGFCFLIFAYIRILLPGVPAIPFILLAAWCFLNSSEKLFQWMLRQKLLGKIFKRYTSNEKMPKPVVWFVISQLWVSLFVAEIILKPGWGYIIAINLTGVVASVFLYRFLRNSKWSFDHTKKEL